MPRHALIHRDPSGSYPVIARGEGIYLIDEQGNRYIDGVAGAGNVTLGHGQKRIAEVMADAAVQTEQVPDDPAPCSGGGGRNRQLVRHASGESTVASDGDLRGGCELQAGPEEDRVGIVYLLL